MDKIKLVPLEALGQVSRFQDFKESTFSHLKQIDLLKLNLTKDDNC